MLAVCLLGIQLGAACSAPCQDSLGVYPPPSITVTGVEAVEVPHIAWECPGFNSDSMDPPPSVAPDAEGQLLLEVTLDPGSTVDARFANLPVALDPAPSVGPNSWALHVPEDGEPLVVRICSADDACAMYWVNTYPA
jgi:hypothetical protein